MLLTAGLESEIRECVAGLDQKTLYITLKLPSGVGCGGKVSAENPLW